MPWYVFRKNPPGNVSNPTDYLLINQRPTCNGSEILCGIKAMDNGFGFPILTNSLIGDIATALNNRTNASNVILSAI